jgi:hypothetical protein
VDQRRLHHLVRRLSRLSGTTAPKLAKAAACQARSTACSAVPPRSSTSSLAGGSERVGDKTTEEQSDLLPLRLSAWRQNMIAPVGGEGEALRPLDLSPRPGSRSRLAAIPRASAPVKARTEEQFVGRSLCSQGGQFPHWCPLRSRRRSHQSSHDLAALVTKLSPREHGSAPGQTTCGAPSARRSRPTPRPCLPRRLGSQRS